MPDREWKPWIKRLALAFGVMAIIVFLIVVNMNRNRAGQWVENENGEPGLTASNTKSGGSEKAAQTAANAPRLIEQSDIGDFESPEITAALERRERKLINELMKANGEREPRPGSPIEEQRRASTSAAQQNLEIAVEPTTGNSPGEAPEDNDGLFSQEAEMPILDGETDGSAMQETDVPQAQPPARPIGYVYAQKRLTILHDAGVVGIAPGSRLAVIERRGENLLVSYEGYRGEVPLIDTRIEP